MESLLKWSIKASETGDAGEGPDPKLMSQLLGAPDDMTLMKEELHAAVSGEEQQQRLECLQKFEDYVENIDNANNIGKMWEPLIYLVNDKDAQISSQALSCIAAAVQNNNKAQLDLVATKTGISIILDKVNDANSEVSSKALLALSSSIAHCLPAYEQFVAANGWDLFSSAFTNNFETGETCSVKIKSRVLSLLFSIVLLAPNPSVHAEIKKLEFVDKLQNLEVTETGIVKDKIENILATLKDNPKQETRFLALD